jgi:hypothetical protein
MRMAHLFNVLTRFDAHMPASAATHSRPATLNRAATSGITAPTSPSAPVADRASGLATAMRCCDIAVQLLTY